MKLTRVATGLAGVLMLLSGSAVAQTQFYYASGEQKPASVEDILKDESAQKGDCSQKDDYCDLGKGCVDTCCVPMCAGDPWKLFPGECSSLDMGGWFQMGYTTPGKNGNGTGMFNNYPNTVQLNQAWFYAEKAIDNGGCGFDWGFRFDYVYGTDGPDTQAFGGAPKSWDNPWDNGGYYGSAIPQLYVELAYNNLSAKVGHFYTICGYEVVPATGNFFYSHAFTMYNAEPFTHTGILAQYAMGDRVTLYGGWTQGWDTGFENNGGSTFLGGFSVDVTDNVTATYTTTMGDLGFESYGGTSDPSSYTHSIVIDTQLTERLNYVLMGDFVDSNGLVDGTGNAAFYPAGANNKWSVVNYLFYDITECIAAGVRYEYYEDERTGIPAAGVNSYTAGLNIKPHRNVVLRPEVRYDDFDPAAAGTVGQDTTLFAMDAIFTY